MLAPNGPAPSPPPHLQGLIPSRGTRMALPVPGALGVGRFFVTENFQFQTLRALMEIPSGSADLNEVLETVKTIVDGDAQSWYQGWAALADRVLRLAERTRDPMSKGNAYLRAHNYLRVAEFMLPPGDPKRPITWRTSLARFDKGLEILGVRCERISVPYLAGNLRAQYFPGRAGAERKPLIMLVGGYDSTLEELYPMLGRAALERGYSVLAYEGPGQGQALRDGLKFTPEWEKPHGAVLDAFLGTHKLPKQIALIGMSLGGYFASRAAAYDKRIDGVVAWDTCFDFGEVADKYFALAPDPILSKSPDFVWFSNNGRWTLGTSSSEETARSLAAYTLAQVADRITQPVLIMAGAEDYGIPLHQTAEFECALINAKSVTTRIFDRASGGAEHCQIGALTLVHATIFDWLLAEFEA
jgi:pimeloyl-ACP methyl ester carboxylesterase